MLELFARTVVSAGPIGGTPDDGQGATRQGFWMSVGNEAIKFNQIDRWIRAPERVKEDETEEEEQVAQAGGSSESAMSHAAAVFGSEAVVPPSRDDTS